MQIIESISLRAALFRLEVGAKLKSPYSTSTDSAQFLVGKPLLARTIAIASGDNGDAL